MTPEQIAADIRPGDYMCLDNVGRNASGSPPVPSGVIEKLGLIEQRRVSHPDAGRDYRLWFITDLGRKVHVLLQAKYPDHASADPLPAYKAPVEYAISAAP